VFRTIGLARSRNLDRSWTIDPQPILPPEEQIENSSLYYERTNHTWFLFTDHIGIDQTWHKTESVLVHEYTDAIWVYWTKDLEHWNPHNKAIVLDGENCRWSKFVHGLPSVVPFGKQLAIFYDGMQGNGTSNIGRDIGLAWLDLPLTPPTPLSTGGVSR
jgi:predicted GH43/DUF377 family glycosyl hydrolase